MFEVKEKPQMVESAFLVGVYKDKSDAGSADSMLEELEELVKTLGISVAGGDLVRVSQYQARYLIGTGKSDEIVENAKELKADCIIFDNELSPVQQRNWEALSGVTVVDREEIILDIFARRAQTREAKLQVQLARLEYSLPRLARAWTHLGRQGGTAGPGAKGEGEQQIELDRRMIRKQIDTVKSDLITVRKNRATQRKTRRRIPIPLAAIVGYTNAGKSSLLAKLTGADVLIADKLFATLDTTTRRIELPNGHPMLLTDTVGFVRKLPHRLVESFKATLEEAVLADFLIHVLDASHPEVETFYRTTLDVLKELGADEKKMITVFNKMDLVENPMVIENGLRNLHPDALFASVHSGQGLDEIVDTITDMLSNLMLHLDLEIPHHRSDLVAQLHEHGKVFETKYEDEYVAVQAMIPNRIRNQFEAFIRKSPKSADE
jgi:GTP-binding protein HflX